MDQGFLRVECLVNCTPYYNEKQIGRWEEGRGHESGKLCVSCVLLYGHNALRNTLFSCRRQSIGCWNRIAHWEYLRRWWHQNGDNLFHIPFKRNKNHKCGRTFIEFSEFRESEKSLKHELGSIEGSSLLPVSLWHMQWYHPVSLSHTAILLIFIIFMSMNSVKMLLFIKWSRYTCSEKQLSMSKVGLIQLFTSSNIQ